MSISGQRPASRVILGGIGTSSKNATVSTSGGPNRNVQFTSGTVADPVALAMQLNHFADALAAQTQSARATPFVGGVLVSGITGATPQIVSHNLGRTLTGWFVTRARLAGAGGLFEHADQRQIVGSTASGVLDATRQIRFTVPATGIYDVFFF